jgi:(p)ppGpp synthase/HD superfamily hydrolase
MSRLADAFDLASQLHADQRRKASAVPYVAHLVQVCGLVLEDGGDDDEAIAALLHDAPEDQGGTRTLALIRERFGDRVADIVVGCSDAMPAPGEAKAPWRERKTAYLAHLEEAPPSVLKVSLADRLHNGRSLVADLAVTGPAVWDRFNAGPEDQAWFFGAALAVYERRLPGSWNLPAFREVVAAIQDAVHDIADRG